MRRDERIARVPQRTSRECQELTTAMPGGRDTALGVAAQASADIVNPHHELLRASSLPRRDQA
jgi:hypothetical protein